MLAGMHFSNTVHMQHEDSLNSWRAIPPAQWLTAERYTRHLHWHKPVYPHIMSYWTSVILRLSRYSLTLADANRWFLWHSKCGRSSPFWVITMIVAKEYTSWLSIVEVNSLGHNGTSQRYNVRCDSALLWTQKWTTVIDGGHPLVSYYSTPLLLTLNLRGLFANQRRPTSHPLLLLHRSSPRCTVL